MDALPKIELGNTFGAYVVGTIFSAALFGVTCSQVFYCFYNYSDGYAVKTMVWTVLILELLHSVFSVYAVYYYLVQNYCNPVTLLDMNWSMMMNVGFMTVNILLVHLFYAWRIYHVGGKKLVIPIIIVLMSVAESVLAWTTVGMGFALNDFTRVVDQTVKYVKPSLVIAVVNDISIAALLSYYLHSSRTGIRSTNTLINKLITYAVANGTLTSITGVVCLVFAFIHQNNMIYISIMQVLGNLYSNALLATLNSRRVQGKQRENLPMTSINFTNTGPSTLDSNIGSDKATVVHINQTVEKNSLHKNSDYPA